MRRIEPGVEEQARSQNSLKGGLDDLRLTREHLKARLSG